MKEGGRGERRKRRRKKKWRTKIRRRKRRNGRGSLLAYKYECSNVLTIQYRGYPK